MRTKQMSRAEKLKSCMGVMLDPANQGELPRLSYPIALLLNHDTNFGLFIKNEDIEQSGWLNDEAIGNGVRIKHRFRGASESTPGILFRDNVFMTLVDESPRMIECNQKMVAASETGECRLKVAKPGTIIGLYTDADGNLNGQGYEMYQEFKQNGWVKLRTLYLIQLLDSNYKPLHDKPFCLSVHGTAAKSFGDAIQGMMMAVYDETRKMAKEEGNEADIAMLSKRGRSGLVFIPSFDLGYSGIEDDTKSAVALVHSYEWDINGNDRETYERVLQTFDSVRKLNNNFATRYLTANAYHDIAPGLSLESATVNDSRQLESYEQVDAVFSLAASPDDIVF